MYRALALLAPVACLLPISLFAAPYDGVYRQSTNAECSTTDGDVGSVRIEEGIFYGVQTECRMTRPVDVNGMNATLFTMECAAQDEQWTERAMLMPTPDGEGLYMIWDGYVFVYSSCPKDAP